MAANAPLNDHERALYARQIRLPEVGEGGQVKIRDTKVLMLGAGGLGSPVALYLASAGVGTIGIADPDKVELANLHRQIIHGFDTLGLPKTISAAEALLEINPGLQVALHPEGLTPENAESLIGRYDIVVDGTDNFATRFLAADTCTLAQKPLVHGSVLRSEGQVGVFLPRAGCYRCVYPVMPDASSVPTCADAGVFGATCGVIGSWMAAEVLAIILGRRAASRLMVVDISAGTSTVLKLARDASCPTCGDQPSIHKIEALRYAATVCPPPPFMPATPLEVSIEQAAQLLASATPPLLIDVREPDEARICNIAGARLIPMGMISERLAEIPQDRLVLIHCHHGGRSLRVTQFLRAKGYAQVSNVQGGINAWSLKIDTTVARY
ncbi:MAG: molybdenum cofactor biosynthesis protein MoeB [Opitutales bacterium]|jgi:adenylyltransferase/sulfurtransferase|nr:MAG: molybdenum cofactor biosynthesis protein MoeB [Opitutales bacterium]